MSSSGGGSSSLRNSFRKGRTRKTLSDVSDDRKVSRPRAVPVPADVAKAGGLGGEAMSPTQSQQSSSRLLAFLSLGRNASRVWSMASGGASVNADANSDALFSPRIRAGSFTVSRASESSSVVSLASRGGCRRHSRDRSLSDVTAMLSTDVSTTNSVSDSFTDSDLLILESPNNDFRRDSLGLDACHSDFEEVHCLLPNGILMDINVHPDDELGQIKQLVLNRAISDERLPLRGFLQPDGSTYSMSYVSEKGALEEVLDENKTLREIKPFQNVLRFSKRSKDKQHYYFRQHVGRLIGKNLSEYDELRNCEVNDFRWRMKVSANKIAQERKSRLECSLEAKIAYQYPPRMVRPALRFPDLKETIRVRLRWNDRLEYSIPSNVTPVQLLLNLAEKYGFSEATARRSFIKVHGKDVYLVGSNAILDFEYVHTCALAKQEVDLVVVDGETIDIVEARDAIYQSLDRESKECRHVDDDARQRNVSLTALSLSPHGLPLSSTVVSTTVAAPVTVSVQSLRLSTETVGSVRTLALQLGLFHGSNMLCPIQTQNFTQAPDDSGYISLHKTFQMSLPVSCLPRMAKLCVGVFEVRKRSAHPLFWANHNMFDYKTTCNPNVKEAAALVIGICDSIVNQTTVEYPADPVSRTKPDADLYSPPVNGSETSGLSSFVGISKLYRHELQSIADRDPLHDLTVQEKELMWRVREYCLHRLPELLPRIVDCVDYTDQAQVFELNGLLERWPVLCAERALQLLDYAYPDEHVRRFAVRCLRADTDDTVLRFLLQLAQALKHESYLQCDLVEFLVERALNNQHIGHHLYWELRAEMSNPAVELLFGLVLEVYLSAAPEHLTILERQNTLIEKCRATHLVLQRLESLSRSFDKARHRFEASVRVQFCGMHPYVNLVSPLNPSLRGHRLKPEQCRLMNSKMRPQLLTFENADRHSADIAMMYKKGDDLRQDRLTLQLLEVMDMVWKEDLRLDLGLSLYRCMSTESDEGLIQIVADAETICSIQMAQTDFRTTAAFRKGLLLAWLKSNNPTEEAMRAAQWAFTRSCAGYSVAMYVLGIGDRHNDNIMVKTNGQMFHIDFGHFLGNFKHKFGIKRERVPMVLSAEFVEVIKADVGSARRNFERFRDLCESAFLSIRRRGALLVSLLAMMISTGMPELSCEQDLAIVRATLNLDVAEEQALEHFRKDFNESLRNAWTISLDWWFHMMNQLRPKGIK